MQFYRRVALLSIAVVATACGGDDDPSGSPPSTAAEATVTTETVTTETVTNEAVADPPATDPPATDPPATDPPATDPPAPAEPVEITVGVPFGIVQIAALGGIADAEPLVGVADATTIAITNPDELRTGFATGELDAAVMPANVAAILFNRDVDVRIVGVVDAQLLQVLGPAGASWSDLEGQTVHLPFPGDIADVTFRQLAAANGVDLGAVQLMYGTSLPDLVAAAASGEVTHAVLPQHFAAAAAAQAMAAGRDLVPAIDLQQAWSEFTGGDRLPQVAVVANGALVDDRPEVVDAIRAAAAASIDATVTDPASASTLAEQTGLPEPLVTAVVASLDLGYRSVADARGDLDLMLESLLADAPESLAGSLPDEPFFAG